MRIKLRIKEVAEEKGVSMGGLSRASGIDKNTIRRLYRDPYREISSYTLIKIAYVLEVRIDDLFTLEDEGEASGPRQWH